MKNTQKSLVVMCIFYMQSCMNAPTCDELAILLKNQIAYNFILTSIDINGHDAYLHGISIIDNSKVSYLEGSGWVSGFADKFKVGDTVYKQKGKYSIELHRKNLQIIIPCECGEQLYQDTLNKQTVH